MKLFNSPCILQCGLFLLAIGGAPMAAMAQSDGPQPVLMVIANQDFYYQEYHAMRKELEAAGLEVVVAAASTDAAIPQDRQDGTQVRPDIALSDVKSEDHSAIVFIGGWGASQYQYDFPGDYDEPDYRPGLAAVEANRLIGEMTRQGKPVAAVCYGVSVLAWARVDGASPLDGKIVAAGAGGRPGFRIRRATFADAEVPMRWDVEKNGGLMLTSGSVGDPLSSEDDVVVDGGYVTAEDWGAARASSAKIAEAVMLQR